MSNNAKEFGEVEAKILGEKVISMLGLKPLRTESKTKGQSIYSTTWGTKSAIGLGMSIKRLVDEN